MKPVKFLKDIELTFIAKDCYDAIQANPDNPKVRQYLMEKEACYKELDKRNDIRRRRFEVTHYIFDPLNYAMFYKDKTTNKWHNARKAIRLENSRPYNRSIYKSACYLIGWYNKVNNI